MITRNVSGRPTRRIGTYHKVFPKNCRKNIIFYHIFMSPHERMKLAGAVPLQLLSKRMNLMKFPGAELTRIVFLLYLHYRPMPTYRPLVTGFPKEMSCFAGSFFFLSSVILKSTLFGPYFTPVGLSCVYLLSFGMIIPI